MVFTGSFREKTIYMKAFKKQVPNLLLRSINAGICKGSGSYLGTQTLPASAPNSFRPLWTQKLGKPSPYSSMHFAFRFHSLGLLVLHKRVCTLFVKVIRERNIYCSYFHFIFHLYVKIKLEQVGEEKDCRSVRILRNTCGSSVFT